MSKYRHHHSYHDRYIDRYYYYKPYNDILIYQLMQERDRYRDLYLDKLYDIDECNPYYAEVTGCRLYR